MGCDELGRTTGDERIALTIRLFQVDVGIVLDEDALP